MWSKDTRDALDQELAQRRSLVRDPLLLRRGEGVLRDVFFGRFSGYLSWTILVLVLQLCEVAVLAYFHHFFFSPESLRCLRILSALTLIPVACALGFRLYTPPPGSAVEQRRETLKRMVPEVLRVVVLIGGLAGLLLLFYLSVGTTVSLSTPPVFRAVIASGIMTLPFDIGASFLFYTRAMRGLPPIRLGLRWPLIGASFLGLWPLATGDVVPYMAIRVLSHISVFLVLFRELKVGSFFSWRGAARLSWGREGRRLGSTGARILLWLLVCEAALFFALDGGRVDFAAPLLSFVIHKLSHIAVVLSLKVMMGLAPSLRIVEHISDMGLRRRIIGRYFSRVSVGVLVLLCGFPLLLSRDEIYRWASPVGDYYVLSGWALLLAGCLIAVRGVSLGVSTCSLTFHRGSWALGVLCALRLAPGVVGGIVQTVAGPFAVPFEAKLILDITGSVAVLLVGLRLFERIPPEAPQVRGNILSGLQPGSAVSVVCLCDSLPPSASLPLLVATREKYAHEGRVSTELWGPRALLVVSFTQALLDDLFRRVSLPEVGHVIASYRSLLLGKEKGSEFADVLLNAAGGRPQADPVVGEALRRLWGQESEEVQVILDGRVTAFPLTDSGWRAIALDTPEMYYRCVRYMAALGGSDPLFPGEWYRHRHRGLVHLTWQGVPRWLLWVPVPHRDILPQLRSEAFRANLDDVGAAAWG